MQYPIDRTSPCSYGPNLQTWLSAGKNMAIGKEFWQACIISKRTLLWRLGLNSEIRSVRHSKTKEAEPGPLLHRGKLWFSYLYMLCIRKLG